MKSDRLTVNRQARGWEQSEQKKTNGSSVRLYITKVDNDFPVNKLETNRQYCGTMSHY